MSAHAYTPPMELRVLRYFEAVARLGSANAAAADLNVAQPAVSRQLRALERELGVDLFDRRKQALTLTPAGRRFLAIVRDLLTRAEAAERFAGVDPRDPSGLRITCLAATLDNVLAPMVACGQLGSSQVRVIEAEHPYRELESGAADLVLTIDPAPHPQFVTVPVRWIHLTVQVPAARDPWERDAAVSLRQLVDFDFVGLTRRSASRIVLDRELRTMSARRAPILEAETAIMAQALAVQRDLPCVVSEEPPRFGLRAHPLHGASGCLGVFLYGCWEAGHYQSPALEALCERMRRTTVVPRCRTATCVDPLGEPEPEPEPAGDQAYSASTAEDSGGQA